MSDFTYAPSQYVPYRGIDPAVIERCRRMTPEELVQHPNPDYKIEILPPLDIRMRTFMDMLKRIITANEEGRNCVLLLPNPWKEYRFVAGFINTMRIDCHRLYCFAMDEYADQDGNIAPADWEWGFVNSMVSSFWANIDEDLRPPRDHFIGFTKENLDHYGEMMQELGGVDCGYFGPGWTGHLAFIEPDAPEFQMPLEEWKKSKARICTLSPFTLAQNSLHGCFGASGDLCRVPPKAATIGPAEALACKYRYSSRSITIQGTFSSWQRLTTRLCLHADPTPLLPDSILQTVPTQVYVSKLSAAPIVQTWDLGY
jgi:glucosamine-6-phosphate deaminase